MTVGNPENFKVQIKTGRDEIDSRVPCDFTNLTLKKLFSWIDSQQVGSLLKAELKKSASRFPHQALPAWQRDFDRHLSKAQSRLRKKKNFSKAPTQPLEDKGPPSEHIEMRATDFGGFEDFDDLDRDEASNELENVDKHDYLDRVVVAQITEELVENKDSIEVSETKEFVEVSDSAEIEQEQEQEPVNPEQTETINSQDNEKSICEENNI